MKLHKKVFLQIIIEMNYSKSLKNVYFVTAWTLMFRITFTDTHQQVIAHLRKILT